MTTIGRHEFALKISEALDIPYERGRKILEDLVVLMEEELASEGILKFYKFGTFRVQSKGKRLGRNPKTKEPKMISEHKTVSFKASKSFKDQVQSKTYSQ